MSGEINEPTLVTHVKARTSGILHDDFYLHIEDVDIDDDARAGLRVVTKTTEQVRPPVKVGAQLEALKDEIVKAIRETAT